MVNIKLKQKYDKEGIVVEALLNNSTTVLVMSSEFTRKNKFKKEKLDRLIYMRNVNSIVNYKEPIEHTVEVELFYRGYKKIMEINIIGGKMKCNIRDAIAGTLQLWNKLEDKMC